GEAGANRGWPERDGCRLRTPFFFDERDGCRLRCAVLPVGLLPPWSVLRAAVPLLLVQYGAARGGADGSLPARAARWARRPRRVVMGRRRDDRHGLPRRRDAVAARAR